MGKFITTRYPGVFYKVLTRLDPNTGKPDRTYYINVPDEFGNPHWVKSGRQSEGMTARLAYIKKTTSPVFPKKQGRTSFSFQEAVDAYTEWASALGKHVDIPLEQYNLHCRKHIHSTLIDSFLPEQAEALKIRLFKKNLSPQSVAHALSFLKRVVNYAIGINRATKNPFIVKPGSVFRMPQVDNKRMRFLTPRECQKLLDVLRSRSPQTYQMAMLSLHTGMRATEIFHLRRDDIDYDAGCLYIRAKGGRRQIVFAPKKTMEMLIKIPIYPGCPYVFPTENGKRRTKIPATFGRVVKELGMQESMSSPYHISFHVFRHTFASLLAQSGKVDLYELKNLLRHRSIEMTMRYAHLIPSVTAQKVNLIAQTLSQVQGLPEIH